MRKRMLLLAGLALSGCAHGGASRLADDSWQSYSSAHFVVETPLHDAAARELVAGLEHYTAALGVTLGVAPPERRMKVIAVRGAAVPEFLAEPARGKMRAELLRGLGSCAGGVLQE